MKAARVPRFGPSNVITNDELPKLERRRAMLVRGKGGKGGPLEITNLNG